MNKRITLKCSSFDVSLRTIAKTDLENLRQWKNTHRFSFFFQDLISSEQQSAWFEGYLGRPNDYMLMIINKGHPIGCLGFRLQNGTADVYNVILGNPALGKRGLMSQAMQLMCSYIATNFTHTIVAQVLTNNPAIEWYNKNGFYENLRHDTYVEMELDMAKFSTCHVTLSEQE